MFNKKEFLKEEQDCARLLGMSLEEYRNYCKQSKVSKVSVNKNNYDNSILTKLGLTKKDLKVRKVI